VVSKPQVTSTKPVQIVKPPVSKAQQFNQLFGLPPSNAVVQQQRNVQAPVTTQKISNVTIYNDD
jgi:hypothetical protein